jgi:hypothetical protein
VIEHVARFFAGHPDLIVGFNAFLPPDVRGQGGGGARGAEGAGGARKEARAGAGGRKKPNHAGTVCVCVCVQGLLLCIFIEFFFCLYYIRM